MGVNVWQLNTIIIHVVTLVPRPYQHGNETSIGIGVYLYAGHMVYMLQTEPPCLFTGDHLTEEHREDRVSQAPSISIELREPLLTSHT